MCHTKTNVIIPCIAIAIAIAAEAIQRKTNGQTTLLTSRNLLWPSSQTNHLCTLPMHKSDQVDFPKTHYKCDLKSQTRNQTQCLCIRHVLQNTCICCESKCRCIYTYIQKYVHMSPMLLCLLSVLRFAAQSTALHNACRQCMSCLQCATIIHPHAPPTIRHGPSFTRYPPACVDVRR